MSVAKVTEIISTFSKSFDDALDQARMQNVEECKRRLDQVPESIA